MPHDEAVCKYTSVLQAACKWVTSPGMTFAFLDDWRRLAAAAPLQVRVLRHFPLTANCMYGQRVDLWHCVWDVVHD